MSSWLENISGSISASNISLSIGPHSTTAETSRINGYAEVGRLVNAPGFITGFLLSTYLHYLAHHQKWGVRLQEGISLVIKQVKYATKLMGSVLLAIILLPPISLLILGFYLYRNCLEVYLKRVHGDRFCGLLDGHDAHWMVEDDKCKSVINVLCTFQYEGANSSSSQILMALRKRLASRLLGKRQAHPKLFYRRAIQGGYAFWTKVLPSEIFIEDFVRLVDIPSRNKAYVTKDELKDWIASMYNADLPKENSTSWEILVGKKPTQSESNIRVYPVSLNTINLTNSFYCTLRIV